MAPRRQRQGHAVLSNWSLLMSCTEISLLLAENTSYNEVIASLLLLLSATGLMLDQSSHRKGSIGFIVPVQVILLFCVLAIVACAHKAQSPINRAAWKFIWVPKVHKQLAFGSTMDHQYVLLFLQPIFFRALCTSGSVCMFVVATGPFFVPRALRSILSLTMILAALWFVPYFGVSLVQQTGWTHHSHSKPTCWTPPPTPLERKPNIVIITIDTWRADLLGNDTMPKTLNQLHARKPGSLLVEWKRHDACAVESDAGYAALYYSMLGMTARQLELHSFNPNIKSWPLEAFRSNGYRLHKVTPHRYRFCWAIMETCELSTRDFDTENQGVDMTDKPDNFNGGKELVFADIKDLFEQWSEENDPPPMLISADLQELHFPYEASQDRRQGIDYFEPAMSSDDLNLVNAGTLDVTHENKRELQSQLINRVKNAMLNLDMDLGNWLDEMRPFMNNTVIILTGDHADLLLDTDANWIGHAQSTPNDLQRAVPLLIHGPEDILSNLKIPDTTVTCHTEVLPSLLEALGATLGGSWKREVFRPSDALQGFAFAQHVYGTFQVLVDGNRRITTYFKKVAEAVHLDDNSKLSKEETKEMKQMLEAVSTRTWPGWNGQC